MNEREIAEKLQRAADLKEFKRAAMQGLCANPAVIRSLDMYDEGCWYDIATTAHAIAVKTLEQK